MPNRIATRAQRYKVRLHNAEDGSRMKPSVWFLDDLVVLAKAPTPDPIPNSAVKAFSAHGTASQDAGESVAARSSGNQPHTP